ncbi:unnamed protein product [Auanema sp. JU1783]|nr:unnamed protein product [Auanema sp. JU1783]
MFVLALMQDTVPIKPHEMGQDLESVIRRRLNKRFCNKIVPDLGLCMCLYDISEMGVTYILPGEGLGHNRVKFRFVVFRPHLDEIVEAKVISSNRQGLGLSLEFFEDIFIPADNLPDPHFFEEHEQVWYWGYQTEDGEAAKLYIDPGKVVRFRVKENIMKDIKPDITLEESKKESSYRIVGTMAEHGLGCVAWWSNNEGVEDEEEEMEE